MQNSQRRILKTNLRRKSDAETLNITSINFSFSLPVTINNMHSDTIVSNEGKRLGKKLVLFDVDYTLLNSTAAHWIAYKMAFRKVYSVELPQDFPHWDGYTDLQIIYAFMKEYRLGRDELKAREIIRVMVEEFMKQDLSKSYLLSGVEELLSELKKDNDVIIGLVTGNIEDIAYAKLKHLRIEEYFVLGGFGETSDVRADLVYDAIRKAEKDYGKIDKRNIFIVGDTHNDIKAARDAGVKVIAVATGYADIKELKKHDPDYLFNDLTDTKKVIDVIQNG